jgi:DNA-directed RNA polymerase specialized sigma24 family protein
MDLYNELYSQLNKLVSSVPSCNFIAYEDKKDIIQNTILTLHNKIEEGKLIEDFKEIRGYSFITLQNFCRAHHTKEKKRETPVSEFWELTDTSTTSEDEEYKEYLHTIVKSYIQQTKYDEFDKRVVELLLDDLEDTEIEIETGLTRREITKHKFRVKNKLKYDWRRPVKYIVRNIFNTKIQVPCFSASDAKTYLDHIPPRRVTYMITDNILSEDGYYIEVLIKKKKRNE